MSAVLLEQRRLAHTVHRFLRRGRSHMVCVRHALPVDFSQVQPLFRAFLNGSPLCQPVFERFPKLRGVFEALCQPGERMFAFCSTDSSRVHCGMRSVRPRLVGDEPQCVWFYDFPAPEVRMELWRYVPRTPALCIWCYTV